MLTDSGQNFDFFLQTDFANDDSVEMLIALTFWFSDVFAFLKHRVSIENIEVTLSQYKESCCYAELTSCDLSLTSDKITKEMRI